MRGFVERLDEINQLAELSPGFVWRLQDESGNAADIHAFDDPLVLINMSVWQDIDSLKTFVYRSVHVDLLRDRDAWFDKTSLAIKPCGGFLLGIPLRKRKGLSDWVTYSNMALQRRPLLSPALSLNLLLSCVAQCVQMTNRRVPRYRHCGYW